jgi:hypothetical protein
MRSRPRVTTLEGEMRKRIRDSLIDDVMDAYVDWRQESAAVDSAYRRWSIAASTDPARAFADYVAALDREELAAMAYEHVMRRTTVVFERDRRRRRIAAQRRARGRARRPPRRRRRARRIPREAGSARGTLRWDRGPVRSAGRRRPRRRAR